MLMITSGQARGLNSNINSYISLTFIAVFTLACGLILWHAALGVNPVEKMLLSSSVDEYSSN